jgi:hypothetical protein
MWPDIAALLATRSALHHLQHREDARMQGLRRWARLDSNQGPTDYESAALTS